MRKNKVAKNVKEFLLDLIFMTAGSVIYAVGLNGFTAPNNIAPGGVSGIAIVLNYLFGTPVGTVILLINVPIIIWAIIEIGYKLVTKTMLAVVLNAACIVSRANVRVSSFAEQGLIVYGAWASSTAK